VTVRVTRESVSAVVAGMVDRDKTRTEAEWRVLEGPELTTDADSDCTEEGK
jgi:hypothetical protein